MVIVPGMILVGNMLMVIESITPLIEGSITNVSTVKVVNGM